MCQTFDYFTFLKNNRDINVKNQREYIHTVEASSTLDLAGNLYIHAFDSYAPSAW